MGATATRARPVGGIFTSLVVLVALLVPASALAVTPGPRVALSGIGVRLIDLPASSAADPLARRYISGSLGPGATISRQVEVSNTTKSVQAISIFPAAASVRRGVLVFAAGGTQNELSHWTSVTPRVLQLKPGATAVETVTVRVPKLASAGERYSVVWAAVSRRGTAGVTLVNRVGVRMYLSVGPGGALPANFAIGNPRARRARGGGRLVVATVRNTGERTLEITGQLTLSHGPGGLRCGPVMVTVGQPLSPHSSRQVNVHFGKQLPRGPWDVQIRLTSGSMNRSSAATITFPGLPGKH
jgi:hypothetical protein